MQKEKVMKIMRRSSGLKNKTQTESPSVVLKQSKFDIKPKASLSALSALSRLVTRQTLALSSAGVALSFVRVDSAGVAVAGFALHPGVAPEVRLALVALAASEARAAVTLAGEQVALLAGRA